MPTTRLALPYPALSSVPNVPADIQALAEALDGAAIVSQGTLAARPTSTPGSPGKTGRFYYVSSGTDIGSLYYDFGTGWFAVRQEEPWNIIGAAGQPAFQNGWANRGGSDETAGFYKDRDRVYLRGGVVRAAAPSKTTIFTLPAGYRPTSRLRFQVSPIDNAVETADPANQSSLETVVEVQTDGDVAWTIGPTGGNDGVRLNMVNFRII